MVRRSRFLIDQIVEQLFARRLIFAVRMHCRQVRRKSCDVMVILPRIIRECFSAEFPACPREIKRMFQEMFRRNVVIDRIEVFVHLCSPDGFRPQIDTDPHQLRSRILSVFHLCELCGRKFHATCKMCLIPRIGMRTQLGRWFSS